MSGAPRGAERVRLHRVATAGLLAAIALPAAVVRAPWATEAVIGILAVACVPETARVARASLFLALLGVALGLFASAARAPGAFLSPLLVAGAIASAMRSANGRGLVAFLFPLYVGLGLGAVRLLALSHGRGEGPFDARPIVLLVLVPVWMTDILGYVVGSRWGSRLLAPGISPKKTVEGAIGGLVGAAASGNLLAPWLGVSPMTGLAAGIVAGTFGPAGDLLESALKRRAGVKDSGSCLPGHGGVLDRIDSLLLAAPAAGLLLFASLK